VYTTIRQYNKHTADASTIGVAIHADRSENWKFQFKENFESEMETEEVTENY